ncbi:hypothetical protein GCM10008094_35370 [Aidingimonas halophila]|nr:hypothetical protein GCM10008094_35370 [Aidingimonas halophila]
MLIAYTINTPPTTDPRIFSDFMEITDETFFPSHAYRSKLKKAIAMCIAMSIDVLNT